MVMGATVRIEVWCNYWREWRKVDEKKVCKGVDLAAWCRRESVKGGGRDALNEV
jgi:hypothetical protein